MLQETIKKKEIFRIQLHDLTKILDNYLGIPGTWCRDVMWRTWCRDVMWRMEDKFQEKLTIVTGQNNEALPRLQVGNFLTRIYRIWELSGWNLELN